jgi:hypothetical protein
VLSGFDSATKFFFYPRRFLCVWVQSPAPNVFVISGLELLLCPICSLPATGGAPKLL